MAQPPAASARTDHLPSAPRTAVAGPVCTLVMSSFAMKPTLLHRLPFAFVSPSMKIG